jgi:hypothetical protein
MSNAYGVSGSTTMSYVATTGIDAGATAMSPDSLLAYCEMQLGDLDRQITTQMNAQKTALREREAVQSAQNVLGQFGTAGPQNAPDMQKCVTALDNAAAQLPESDPVRAQLADFRTQMCTQYGFKSAQQLNQDKLSEPTIASDFQPPATASSHSFPNYAPVQPQAETTAVLGKKPDAGIKEWQGTTDALAGIANDIKSNAEIEMLHLQDLVSQRQQAIQLCSGMMSKTDQTLEDQAKAIGRG